MDNPSRLHRRLLGAALVIMLVAVLDPFEGSLVILAGAVLAAVLAVKLGSPQRLPACIGAVLIAVGVAALWSLSAVGGLAGDTGRSHLWWFALVPYPIGWFTALCATALALGERPDADAAQGS